jgi:hypothetical protein
MRYALASGMKPLAREKLATFAKQQEVLATG